MLRRQTLPRLWLMTDERLGDTLIPAVERLPRGAGIVFRHYSLPEGTRRALFNRIRSAARRRGLLLLLGGPDWQSRAWGADGSHGRGRGSGLRSTPVHDLAEIRAAERDNADFLFLSPVLPTRSHPRAPVLGLEGFARLARRTRLPVIALGGVNQESADGLLAAGAYGWAGIDAWTRGPDPQKRKAVPT